MIATGNIGSALAPFARAKDRATAADGHRMNRRPLPTDLFAAHDWCSSELLEIADMADELQARSYARHAFINARNHGETDVQIEDIVSLWSWLQTGSLK